MLLAAPVRAQDPVNILQDDPSIRFKAAANCRETYKERLVTVKAGPAARSFREVVAQPQSVSAKVVANLSAFDSAGITSSMPVSLALGDFFFSGTLAESDEAVRAGGVFPAGSNKATFGFAAFGKRVGSLVFAWNATRLTVNLKCRDIDAAGLDGIAILTFTGLPGEIHGDGPPGSGVLNFADSVLCSLRFGAAAGERHVRIQGTVRSDYKRFLSATSVEEFYIESGSLTGAIFVLPRSVGTGNQAW